MKCVRKVTNNLYWVGGSDRRLSRFENLFPIPLGIAYNSYLYTGEHTVLLDTVDRAIYDLFIENITYLLNGRDLEYLVINHMEPDHCSGINGLMKLYPNLKLIGNKRTFQMLVQFFPEVSLENSILVEDGSELTVGELNFKFIMTPMLHWPESMVTYEATEKILFSADAFGSFGAIGGNIFQDEVDYRRYWMDEIRRYYANIVGKYGTQVQAALNKMKTLDIKIICPLHGIIWRNDIDKLIEKYDKWSRYEAEDRSVLIIYGSVYGRTENAADILACSLAEAGVKSIKVCDVSETQMSYITSEVLRCSHIVFASPTYNGEIYPPMQYLIEDLRAHSVKNRVVGFIENGSWSPTAGRRMKALLDGMKAITILEPSITIRSSVDATNEEYLESLCKAILDTL